MISPKDPAEGVMAQAIAYARGQGTPPRREAVVEAMLAAEKTARAERQPLDLPQLIGDWQLTFITGTKKTRTRAGVMLGAGRFLPGWIKIGIAYGTGTEAGPGNESGTESGTEPGTEPGPETGLGTSHSIDQAEPTGWVKNRVRFGAVDLTVSGPIQLYRLRRVLAFDFIQLRFRIAGINLFEGYVKGGAAREQAFAAKSLRDQAFFTYFLVQEDLIAARGRGGGLALWVRQSLECT